MAATAVAHRAVSWQLPAAWIGLLVLTVLFCVSGGRARGMLVCTEDESGLPIETQREPCFIFSLLISSGVSSFAWCFFVICGLALVVSD